MGINIPSDNYDKEIYLQSKDMIDFYLADKADSIELRNKAINERNIAPEIIRKDVLSVRKGIKNQGFFSAYDGMIKDTGRIQINQTEEISQYRSLMGSLLNIFKSEVQSKLIEDISNKANQDILNRFETKKAEIKRSSINEIREKLRKSLSNCKLTILENIIKEFNKYTKDYAENKFTKFELGHTQSRAFDDVKKKFRNEFSIEDEQKEAVFIMLICLQEKHNESPQGEQGNLF